MPDDGLHQDLDAYAALLRLWQNENLIKTLKLQALLAVNAGLLIAAAAVPGAAAKAGIAAGACLLSVVWTLSIGRTVLSQQTWKAKLRELHARYPGDPRFAVLDAGAARRHADAWLRALGGVSSKYYLLGAPLLCAAAWLLVLLACLRRL